MNIISVIGRPCAGKGTQIRFFEEETGYPVMMTGKMLRERATEDDLVGKKIAEAFEKGASHPTAVVFSIWTKFFFQLKESSEKGVVLDGSPRKLYEAWMLEELFQFLDWEECWKVFYIDITEEESYERMKKRLREYDSEEEVRSRLEWFNAEVVPVVDYFREKNMLVEINGSGSIEDVWKEIKLHL